MSPHTQTTTLKHIRDMLVNDKEIKPLDINTRDVLLFGAIIDIYEVLETLKPASTFYRVGLFFATALQLRWVSRLLV